MRTTDGILTWHFHSRPGIISAVLNQLTGEHFHALRGSYQRGTAVIISKVAYTAKEGPDRVPVPLRGIILRKVSYGEIARLVKGKKGIAAAESWYEVLPD